MYVIQPHYHAIARTAQDYEKMAMAGVVAVAEPAFWAGFDRDYPETFLDYFKQIADFEPTRAAWYGIKHYCWLAVNPKEAENPGLTRRVLDEMPQWFEKPTVLGIGETGLHKSTPNEVQSLEWHLQLALDYNQLVLIHTPHLDDKVKGTKKTLEVLENFTKAGLPPERVWIDHVEEHTVRPVLEAGFWAGMTLYPLTKMTGERAADVIEMYGSDRLLVNSSADWGPSDPFTLQSCILECRRRGWSEQELTDIFHNNPARFMRQSGKFPVKSIRVETIEDQPAGTAS